jgi:hypothetical protein
MGRPGLTYLEVGLYEGRSAIWMLENVLTHPTARLIGIDPFICGTKERFDENLKHSGCASRTRIIIGESRRELPKLEDASCDVIYLDGSHSASDVLVDAVLSWPLLKIDGLLIFDDYEWPLYNFPDELRPKLAVDAFVSAYQHELTVEGREYQVVLRKQCHPCPSKWCSTPIGSKHLYDWQKKVLTLRSGDGPLRLSDSEIALLEMIGHSKSLGRVEYSLPGELLDSEDYQALKQRLGLEGPGL